MHSKALKFECVKTLSLSIYIYKEEKFNSTAALTVNVQEPQSEGSGSVYKLYILYIYVISSFATSNLKFVMNNDIQTCIYIYV